MSRYTADTSHSFTNTQRACVNHVKAAITRKVVELDFDSSKEHDDTRETLFEIIKKLHNLETEICSYSFE